jgi:group I intron endonuclease
MIGIYKITNPKGKIYIGQTIDYERRFRHYKNLRCKEQPKLYNSFKKYGVDNHTFEVIQECQITNLTILERYYQELYNSTGLKGLNCILVKTDEFSGGHSEESKKKISKSMKGRKPSKKQNEWLLNYNKTRVLSELTRLKLSLANKGRKVSEETKQKQYLAKIGKIRSEETRKKISESMKLAASNKKWKENLSNKLKGRTFSEESKAKMRQSAIKRHNKDN